jgi:hypothetical protein
MVRLCVNLQPEQAARLKARATESGILQSEIVRRAIDAVLGSENGPPLPAFLANEFKPPVLFHPKVETRNA